jgi:hypothetical protein
MLLLPFPNALLKCQKVCGKKFGICAVFAASYDREKNSDFSQHFCKSKSCCEQRATVSGKCQSKNKFLFAKGTDFCIKFYFRFVVCYLHQVLPTIVTLSVATQQSIDWQSCQALTFYAKSFEKFSRDVPPSDSSCCRV